MCPSSGLWGGGLDCDSQFTIPPGKKQLPVVGCIEESVKQQILCQIKPREMHITQHQCNFITIYLRNNVRQPPKNGKIALVLATNCGCEVKHVSPKRNEFQDKSHKYNILVTFIFKFKCIGILDQLILTSNASNFSFESSLA